MLAQFREAALLSQNGKIDEAIAAYDGLATSLNDTHLRELALVLAGNLLIDKGVVAAVEQRVGGLITPASPMRNAAREVMGLVQYRAGKLDDAMKSFQAIITDPLASRDAQNRVQIYILQLQAEGAKLPPPPVNTAASSAPPVASSAPDAGVSSASSETSAAVDASTQLDVTPPVVVDTSALSLALPQESAASSEAAPTSASESQAASSAPAASSEAPPASAVSSAVSSAPVASSSAP